MTPVRNPLWSRAGDRHDVVVTGNERASSEQRLHDAAAEWDQDRRYGSSGLIDAACQALIEGLDSPTLRELADASPRDSSWEIRELVGTTLDELGIPQPGSIPAGHVVAAGGGLARRTAVDVLRLAVLPAATGAGGGFEVRVHVNDAEMTSAGAGLGMDPYDLLIPTNRLLAMPQPHTVPIARCECGVYGCGSTDVGGQPSSRAGTVPGGPAAGRRLPDIRRYRVARSQPGGTRRRGVRGSRG